MGRFAPELKVLLHHGSDRLTDEAFVQAAGAHDLVVSSFGLLRRDADTLGKIRWSAVIVDEAQNIKNPETRQAQIARKLPADYRIALTGTPVENRLSDLWSIMQFLNPGYLGSQRAFRQEFVVPIERYGDADAAARLRRLVQPFVLRRLKTDPTIISDLPEKNEMKVYCPLTPEQATLYEAVVKDTLEKVESSEGIERRGLVLAMLMKLKQVCNHPAHFLGDGSALAGRSGKLARLAEMLEEVQSIGDRALVFTQFYEMGEMLRKYLGETLGGGVQFLHGGTPQRQRERMVARFQEDGGRAGHLHPLAEGRRHRAEPDPRQPRLSLRPLVEPGRGEPGHRPRLPHRPAAGCAGAQVRLPGHAGGTHRRPDREQARAGGKRRGHRRGLADRTLHRPVARPAGAAARGGG